MRIRHSAVLAASILSLVPSAPAAHAAAPTVASSFTVSFNRREAGGWLVTVGCKAIATQGSDTQVPLATKVTCSVNDTVRSALVGGGAAVTHINIVAPIGPVYACHSGEAVLLDVAPGSSRLYHVTNAQTCIRLPDT